MMKRVILIGIVFILAINICASAHVPYFEHKDFSEEKPFIVRKILTQSKAAYSWLETDWVNPCEDIDVYQFNLIRKLDMYIELIVPVAGGFYNNYTPWYALVGPGLPDPGQALPFDIPDGYGAIVMENVEPGDPREKFFEPFGNKWYFEGPKFKEPLDTLGVYYIYVWDPHESGGDYTLVIGDLEIWGPFDILRALIYTPLIRWGLELHIN